MCKKPLYRYMGSSAISYNSQRSYINLDDPNDKTIAIPCGKCFECKVKKIKKIQSKFILHINHLQKTKQPYYCYFITLTYNDNNIDKVLNNETKNELQKWLKRIRKNHKLKNVKYVATTEIGSEKGRLHHHVFLIADKDFLPKQSNGKRLKNGFYYYKHNDNIAWTNGFHSIAQIETDKNKPEHVEKALSYVLKYVLKSPVNNLQMSKKIAFEAIEKIENKKTGMYLFNGYSYKTPWYKNNLSNSEKVELNHKMLKTKQLNKITPPLELGTNDPETW